MHEPKTSSLRTRVHEYFKTFDDGVMQKRLLALLESSEWNIDSVAYRIGVTKRSIWRVIKASPTLTRARIRARAEQALKKVS